MRDSASPLNFFQGGTGGTSGRHLMRNRGGRGGRKGRGISWWNRRQRQSHCSNELRFEQLESRLAMAVVINEFLADNNSGITDLDGERQDWLELKNTAATTANLGGWYLTDTVENLTRWQIPAGTTIAPGEHLLIFASGKNLVGSELHTNFSINDAGEDLLLVRDDGTTIEHSYLAFPEQFGDVSYGIGVTSTSTSNVTLVGASSPLRILSPVGEDTVRDDHWRDIDFDDSSWLSGTRSVGFDRNGATGGDFSPYIGRTLSTVEMPSTRFTAYVRFEFEVTNKDQLTSLELDLRFDDGVAIYLNGREYDRINAGVDFARPKLQWDSRSGYQQGSSTALVAVNRDTEALAPVTFDLTALLPELVNGTNVLAFHALNGASTAAQQDFLLEPVLRATRATGSAAGIYMAAATPGEDNGLGTLGFVADTNFSLKRGFYTAPIQVDITTNTPAAVIRYTTDGSAPTLTNGSVYAGPITVSTTTVLRAAAFKEGWTPTNVDTQTYVFLADVVEQDASYVTQSYATWGHDKEDADSLSGYQLDDESDWEMDPAVVGGIHTTQEVIDALAAIPSMSIVMDWDDLFGGTPMPGTPAGTTTVSPAPQGIYIHGRSDERAASLEYFHPDNPADQFQVDAAIEMQGHSSLLRWNADKMSFEVKFKFPYGDTSLDHPLFDGTPDGENAVTHFDNLILDSQFNYTWIHQNTSVQTNYATYITDQVMSDLQNLASNGGHHGKWVHLYVNGLYWGVYNAHERPTDSFAAEYYGGDKDDYYVVKHANGDVNHEFTWSDGGNAAEIDFENLLNAARAVSANPTNATLYAAVENVLDVDQFIDYMVVHYYGGGGADWSHNNWYATRNANGGKWRFHAWDQEHAFPNDNNSDSWTQLSDLTEQNNFETSTEIHNDLMANGEYRLRFADRVQELMYHGGVLTESVAAAVYQARIDEIGEAIIGESARWGDNRATTPYDQSDFLANTQYTIDEFFPVRTNTVLGQFDARGWIPSLDAPLFSQYGGEITSGYDLTISKPIGSPGGAVIYYTLDGTDPRDAATNLASGSAVLYSSAIDLTLSAQVKARIYFNNAGANDDWSPIIDKTFLVEAQERFPLRIVELHYNPAVTQNHEFIELLNIGGTTIGLDDVAIGSFASEPYLFPDGLTLAAGERIVVARNPVDFQNLYGSEIYISPLGYANANLSNGGEPVSLHGPFGELIQHFTYGDSTADGWPDAPDGDGPSLEYIGPLDADPEDPNDVAGDPYDDPSNWRASLEHGGSPGESGEAERIPGDYDDSGEVDDLDYIKWRSQYGMTVDPFTESDGNGDGVVDAMDYTVWRNNFGAMAPGAGGGGIAPAGVGGLATVNTVVDQEQELIEPDSNLLPLSLLVADASGVTLASPNLGEMTGIADQADNNLLLWTVVDNKNSNSDSDELAGLLVSSQESEPASDSRLWEDEDWLVELSLL
jgi:hypothetical protein